METILNNCIFAIPFVLMTECCMRSHLERKWAESSGLLSDTAREEAAEIGKADVKQKSQRTGETYKRMLEDPYVLHYTGLFLFCMAVCSVFSLTGLSPVSGFSWNIHGIVNLVPLEGIQHIIDVSADHGRLWFILKNILGNILLFFPVGFFLPLLWTHFLRFRNTLLFGMGLSGLIECCQLFLIRATDVDDVMLNTLGTGVGFLLFLIFHRLTGSLCLRCREEGKERKFPGREAIVSVGIVFCAVWIRGLFLIRADLMS